MIRTYLPALVFIALGTGLAAFLIVANSVLGPRPRNERSRREAYECGLSSDAAVPVRTTLHFYLVGLLFLVFGVEVILLWPIAVQLRDAGVHGLLAAGVFVFFLAVAFVYEWARGTLEWDVSAGVLEGRRE
jgi:NADH-quinone oxidoreductase subunit A